MNVEIKGLNKKINKHYILKDINLDFESEGINVIIGPNGAGKTSLLRIIGLLDNPTSGEIIFDGKSSAQFISKDRLNYRRKMGVVFQQPILLNGTVYQNIIYGLKFRNLGLQREKIQEVIFKLGLLDKIKEEAKKLSVGEKQRLQLARILVANPELYLLDEPTSNLDPITTKKIEEIIKELVQLKKTIILTTHNLLQARHLAKKIFFIKDGEIIQEGNPEEIFEIPLSLDMAEFSLSENIIFGEILKEGEQTYLLVDGLKINVVTNISSGLATGIIRPEEILISQEPFVSSARNCLLGKIKRIENLGLIYSVEVKSHKLSLISYITKQSLISMDLKILKEVYLVFKATSVYVLPANSGNIP